MPKLPTITLEKIRSYNPCKDPDQFVTNKRKKNYNALDILSMDSVTMNDRLWLVLRTDLLNDKVLRLFAVDCAESALRTVKNPDPHSVKAVKVAKKYANGKATDEELSIARNASYAIAYAASYSAASYSAAASAAASYSAASATSATSASSAAAYAASASASAAYSAYSAYSAASASSERKRQIKSLVKLIKKEYQTPAT